MLIEQFQKRFGERIPLIRREHVREFAPRKPDWLVANMPIEKAREEAEAMENAAHRFYLEAAKRSEDAGTRRLLGDLAMAEKGHETIARRLKEDNLPEDVRAEEDEGARRQFVLTYVQPGLAGLMDGSVSTLAPIFAAAFATQDTWQTFLVGLSASVGAGISMGFTEAAHDDGKLSGRGSPVKRGLASGIMTALGGLGHALPYLIPHFWTATAVAVAGGVLRTLGHRLHPEPLHGNALPACRLPGGAWRWAGAGCRYPDRQRLTGMSHAGMQKGGRSPGRLSVFTRP